MKTMNKKPTRCTIVLKSLKFYCILIPLYMMHGTMNLKFISAKQAKEVYEYKNIK
jgi:hypothetical protein